MTMVYIYIYDRSVVMFKMFLKVLIDSVKITSSGDFLGDNSVNWLEAKLINCCKVEEK